MADNAAQEVFPKPEPESPFLSAYRTFKEATRQTPIVAPRIAGHLSTLYLPTVLEVGASYGSGALGILQAAQKTRAGITRYVATDIDTTPLRSAGENLRDFPQVEIYDHKLDWTSGQDRSDLLAHLRAKPTAILSLYNLFLMGSPSVFGKTLPPTEIEERRQAQKEALAAMIDSAGSMVCLVQAAGPGSGYYEESPMFAAQKAVMSNNYTQTTQVLTLEEIRKVAEKRGKSVTMEVLGPESDNYLTATRDKMVAMMPFLFGPGFAARPELAEEWFRHLDDHNWKDAETGQYKVPIRDILYIIRENSL